jgi:hypothetical protein
MLASTVLVRAPAGAVVQTATGLTRSTQPLTQPPPATAPTAGQSESSSDRMASIRQTPGPESLSSTAERILHGSIRTSTRRTYDSCWRRWQDWNHQQSSDPANPSVVRMLNYLAFLLDSGLSANSLSLHKSAIFSLLAFQTDEFKDMANSERLVKFLRGAFNQHPKIKPSSVWDVDSILSILRSWGPNTTLTLLQLFRKTLVLLALVSACRVAELASLSRTMQRHAGGCTLRLKHLKKNSSAKSLQLDIDIFYFLAEPLLCPLQCLELYLSRIFIYRGLCLRHPPETL